MRREHPTDDVISDLLAPKIDGEVLTEHEFNNFFTLLVAAGNDTTRYTMTAGHQGAHRAARPARPSCATRSPRGDAELVASARSRRSCAGDR